ncbi:DUF6318 family protein [Rothia endophytica]|uniref:DUF6318 family protein n=1 Tax=Rothia endophytica TaxID=1324766 RepID=UPI001F2B1EEF|nr:DUF6318 family protein [Rothia endophytica]
MRAPRYLTQTLTLAALGALVLSGCGEKATGSIPEPGNSSSSAASASVPAGASEGATAEAAESYSGGSKAPEGEYRAADEQGPAQNVPKPETPAAMNVETTEGMEKFITYYQDMRNYALQTGDVDGVRQLVDESFTQEQDFFDSLEEIYKSDGWVIEGKLTIHYNKDLITSMDDGVYSIGSNFEQDDSVLWYDGEATYTDNSDSIYEGIDFRVQFKDSKWKVLTSQTVK